MRRPDPEGVFWALLFGLPVGAGVALAAGRSVNAPPTIPLALAMGALAAVTISGVVLLAVATNPDGAGEPPLDEEAVESDPD